MFGVWVGRSLFCTVLCFLLTTPVLPQEQPSKQAHAAKLGPPPFSRSEQSTAARPRVVRTPSNEVLRPVTIDKKARGDGSTPNPFTKIDRHTTGVVETVTIYYPVRNASATPSSPSDDRPATVADTTKPVTITPAGAPKLSPAARNNPVVAPAAQGGEAEESAATKTDLETAASTSPAARPAHAPSTSTSSVTQSETPGMTLSTVPTTITSPSRVPTETKATLGSADAIALNNTAVLLSSRSDYDQAAELLRRAIEQAPDSYKFHRNLSVVYEGMKKYDQALAAARRAAELAPRDPSVMMQLCGLHLITRKDEDAVSCYENLFSFSPEDGVSLTFYAVALLRCGKASKAIPILKNVARTHPTAAVFNALGIGYMDEKLYSDAVASFKSAVEADPDEHQLRFNLGVAQLAVGNREGAISQYRMLKLEDPALAAKLMQLLSRGRVVVADRDR